MCSAAPVACCSATPILRRLKCITILTEISQICSIVGDIISGIGDVINSTVETLGQKVSNAIFDSLLQWYYESIYNAIADFFAMMGNMGAEIFDLAWVQATIKLFTLFGWALFVAGMVVAVFDVAIEYQNGRANIKATSINILKGFFACSMLGVVPVELYKFCISLQNTFSRDLSSLMASGLTLDLPGQSTAVLAGSFAVSTDITFGLLNLLCMIAFAYCVHVRQTTVSQLLNICWENYYTAES